MVLCKHHQIVSGGPPEEPCQGIPHTLPNSSEERAITGSGKSQSKGDKMTPYIVNLTNTLIDKHRFDVLFCNREDYMPDFTEMVAEILSADDIRQMNPETLGRILGSMETGDVIASKQELKERLYFGGDLGEMLRSMVAVCVAYVITSRLDPKMEESHIPRYNRTSHSPNPTFNECVVIARQQDQTRKSRRQW
jgi:hypothetical protein